MKHFELEDLNRKLNEKAILWNKTKDPIHKTNWNILLKKFSEVYKKVNPEETFTDLQ
jgi:hypothetical protein